MKPAVADAHVLPRCVWCGVAGNHRTRIEIPGAVPFHVCADDEQNIQEIARHLVAQGAAKGASASGLRLPQTTEEWEKVFRAVRKGVGAVQNAVTAYTMIKNGVPIEEVLKATLREALK